MSMAATSSAATTGLVGLLLQTLLAERTSFATGDSAELASLKELTGRLTRDALANMPCAADAPGKGVVTSPAKPVTAQEIAVAN